MKRRDIYWVAAYGLLAAATVLLCVTGGFAWFNAMYPYLAGFIQFSVYATAGELLSGRMLEGHWQINRATWFKSVSWGVGGLFVTPIHSALMRVCGNYGEIRFLEGRHITPRQAVDSVDWGELVDFTLFKTIPLFWIPINTVGFLLPQEYRIVFAAVLSLVFGILMTILKLRERKNQSRKESLV